MKAAFPLLVAVASAILAAGECFAAADKPECKYKNSARKIAFMVRRFEEDGFTSFWL